MDPNKRDRRSVDAWAIGLNILAWGGSLYLTQVMGGDVEMINAHTSLIRHENLMDHNRTFRRPQTGWLNQPSCGSLVQQLQADDPCSEGSMAGDVDCRSVPGGTAVA